MPKRNDRPKLRQRVPRPRRTKRWVEIPEPLVPDSPSEKLRRLELDFRADHNPVLAWQAIALTRQLRSDLPSWLMDYLAKAAAEITAIFDRVMAGHPAGKEPEQVGRALGFGRMGPGRGGYFERAKLRERERRVYLEVQAELDRGKSSAEAYRLAQRHFELSYPEMKKAYRKMREMLTNRGRQHGVC